MADTFKCAACGGVFEKGRSEDDAMAEKEALFPDVAVENCGVVCDDCFKAMGYTEPAP